MVDGICGDIGSFDKQHEPLPSIILEGSDPTVKMVLASDLRKKNKKEKAQALAKAKAQAKGQATTKGGAIVDWPNQHQRFLAVKKRLPWPLMPSDKIRKSPWYKLLQPREREIVAYGEIKGWSVCDVSQTIARVPKSISLVHPTVTPGAKMWYFEEKRFLTGFEACAIQQIPLDEIATPAELMKDFSHRDLQNLAGNAFTGGCIALILCCMLKGIQYEPESEDDDEDSEQDLMLQTVRAFGALSP